MALMRRHALNHFSANVNYNTSLLGRECNAPGLPMGGMFLFNSMGYEACDVSPNQFATLMLSIASLVAVVAGLAIGLIQGTNADGRVAVTANLHKERCVHSHAAGLVLVVAKQTGILEHLPLGTCALIRTLILATAPESICALILEVQRCVKWLQSMSAEETAQVVELSRPQLEDILPSILSAPYSVMASLQSLLLSFAMSIGVSCTSLCLKS
ncbi:hypothetical protein KIPB_000070 [Kipferlia bialata]|uniref:Uncharacterized protein n=1 Tax=Kipferlia bialata TaxID=797122 RepID=A0A9K3GEG1_9EUKA|nr:hypothetical protein KIPB_000070 [Kipferlia bialata]|eukprot:g70.t1